MNSYTPTIHSPPPTGGPAGPCCPGARGPYLVGLLAEVAAVGLHPGVHALVLVQQGGAVEHLVADGALVEVAGVAVLEVLPVLLHRREAQAALLAVVGLQDVWGGHDTLL